MPEAPGGAMTPMKLLERSIFPLLKRPGATQPDPASFTLGRHETNDWVLADPSISGVHARLRLSGGVWLLRDLQSTNGTSVNGRRLGGDPVELKEGDALKFGRFQFLFLGPSTLHAKLRGG
ncbi:MAG: FHA domain-containing protein [Magnetococcales bacterium]|nr:FHA domain-containing protein [Magnetococcales bacterium]